jgi:hypothetical protein
MEINQVQQFINQDQGREKKIQLLYFPRDITWIERNPQDGTSQFKEN